MPASSSLELAVLGLLKEGPMHGYELRKRLGTTIGPLWAVSFGSLYPCLKRLRKADFIAEAQPAPRRKRRRKGESAPKTTRRARKVYEITPEGEAYFFDQLEQGAVYDTDRFQTRFAFFRYLPRESRILALERRKAYLQEKLIEFKQSLRATKEKIDAYSLSLIEHGMQATEQDIQWLEGLIDAERGDSSSKSRAAATPT